jgi:16S rRNA processing protein RimM
VTSASGGTGDVAVGRIGPAKGVRGDVFVEPWTDDPDARFAPGRVLRTEPPAVGPLTVATTARSGGKLVVRFDGVEDRTAAENLRGVQLVMAASERAPLDDPDEYYATDLIGLDAFTTDGLPLGPVRDVLDIAGADYLVLEIDARERLVPFVASIVPIVDLTARRVVIDPPAGLFEL